MPIDGYEEFFNKKNVGRTVKNFIDFEKSRNVEPIAEKPVAEEPVAEEPVAEEPIAEEPIAEEPIAEEPVVETPVISENKK